MQNTDEQVVQRNGQQIRQIATSMLRVGIAVVLLSLSAGVSIPIGPVPFTLQILVLGIIVATMRPSEAIASTVAYVAIGAMGAPVFSGYVGGLVRLLGPSGGFIYGFAAGAAVGTVVRVALEHVRAPKVVAAFAGVLLAIAVSYLCGWGHLVFVTQLTPAMAWAVGCAPFVLVDLVKAALAVAISVPAARLIDKRG